MLETPCNLFAGYAGVPYRSDARRTAGSVLTMWLGTPWLLLFLLCCPPGSWAAAPLADVHTHYKWSQEDVTSPQQAVQILLDNDVALAVVIGTPTEYALKLEKIAAQRIVPFWSPYRAPGDWSTWAFDEQVLQRARTALASGDYRGIGELHLIGGFAPHWRTPVIRGLMEIAGDQGLPVLLHTELSQPRYLIGLCQAYPAARILWAHAGAILSAKQVRRVMTSCPNVWSELSARDPWRFVNNPITDSDGVLLAEWKQLIETFPDRFMLGSDPVWPVERLDSWDEADTGWKEYSRFIEFHRTWLKQLPPDIARMLRLTNALEFFQHAEKDDDGSGRTSDTPPSSIKQHR